MLKGDATCLTFTRKGNGTVTRHSPFQRSGFGRGAGVGHGHGVGLRVGPAVCVGVGDGPPSFVVRRIVPPSPTAIPLKASLAKETSLMLAEVPLV